jgi:hypothetical protein
MKRTGFAVLMFIPALALLVLTATAAVSGQSPQSAQSAQQGSPTHGGLSFFDFERVVRGFHITPVKLNLRGKNVALVGLGSYLVNATGGCNDCHTNPSYAEGGDPFAGEPEQINVDGYLAGGRAFGPFIARNLTPDEQGRPAGYTLQQFFEVMRTGRDLKQLPPPAPSPANDLLQVMPWPVFRNLSDTDLRAIYEFLRAIPTQPGFPR